MSVEGDVSGGEAAKTTSGVVVQSCLSPLAGHLKFMHSLALPLPDTVRGVSQPRGAVNPPSEGHSLVAALAQITGSTLQPWDPDVPCGEKGTFSPSHLPVVLAPMTPSRGLRTGKTSPEGLHTRALAGEESECQEWGPGRGCSRRVTSEDTKPGTGRP